MVSSCEEGSPGSGVLGEVTGVAGSAGHDRLPGMTDNMSRAKGVTAGTNSQ